MMNANDLRVACKALSGSVNVEQSHNRLSFADQFGCTLSFPNYAQAGMCAVDVEALDRCLKAFDKGPIMLSVESDRLCIVQDSFRVRVASAERVEIAPELSSALGPAYWPDSAARKAIAMLVKVASKDESRPILNGVNGHTLGAYATDGHRIHVDRSVALPVGFHIPSHIIKNLPMTGDIAISRNSVGAYGAIDVFQSWIPCADQVPDITRFFAIESGENVDLKALSRVLPKTERVRFENGAILAVDKAESTSERAFAVPFAGLFNCKYLKDAIAFLGATALASDTGQAIVLTTGQRSVCIAKVV